VLLDNDTGISMTPLGGHEQNTQFGAGRAAMLATRPAVQKAFSEAWSPWLCGAGSWS
jgi:hypothetical protein